MIAATNIGPRACLIFLMCLGGPGLCSADILVCENGERFVGRVLELRTDAVVFESEIGGRMTVPRNRIRELRQSTSPPQEGTNNTTVAYATNQVPITTAWRPPAVGQDGSDWLQLKSGEWLRGTLRYVQDKKVHFDSEELEELTFKLKDVLYLYSAQPMFTKFEEQDQVYGTVILSSNRVEVIGPEQVAMARQQLTGIAPGGKHEIDFLVRQRQCGT